jgi:hypothetical protein
VGQYPDWPLLEDTELARKLKRRFGAPAIVPRGVQTSGRRWRELGVVQTTLLNQIILIGHALGVDVATLAKLYTTPRGTLARKTVASV